MEVVGTIGSTKTSNSTSTASTKPTSTVVTFTSTSATATQQQQQPPQQQLLQHPQKVTALQQHKKPQQIDKLHHCSSNSSSSSSTKAVCNNVNDNVATSPTRKRPREFGQTPPLSPATIPRKTCASATAAAAVAIERMAPTATTPVAMTSTALAYNAVPPVPIVTANAVGSCSSSSDNSSSSRNTNGSTENIAGSPADVSTSHSVPKNHVLLVVDDVADELIHKPLPQHSRNGFADVPLNDDGADDASSCSSSGTQAELMVSAQLYKHEMCSLITLLIW